MTLPKHRANAYDERPLLVAAEIRTGQPVYATLCTVPLTSSHEIAVIVRTRRELLIATRNLAAAAFVATIAPRMAWANAVGLPPGIQLYAVRDRLATDTPGALKELHDIGFLEVETAGFGKYSATDFRKMLDDAGLRVPSAHVNLNAPDLGPTFAECHTIGA